MTEQVSTVLKQRFDARQAIKDLKKWGKIVQRHDATLQRAQNRMTQGLQRDARQTQRVRVNAEQRATQAAQREAEKRAKAAQKAAEKERKAAKKLSDFQKRVFRSTAFANMNLEEKMAMKRVLTQQKANDEIFEDYKKLQAKIARERRTAAARQRKQAKRGGAGAAPTGIGGKLGAMSGAMTAVAANPAALAATAAVGASVAALNKGLEDYKQVQMGAIQTGMDFQEFQKQAFINQANLGWEAEKTASVYQDVNDRLGEALAEMKWDEKTQQFTGGEGSIAFNRLMKAGLVTKDNYKQLTKDMSPTQFIEFMQKAFVKLGSDSKEISFVMEAFASDSAMLMQQMINNQEARAKAEEKFDSMGLGLSKEDQKNVERVSQGMTAFGAAIENLGMQFTTAFASLMDDVDVKNLEFFGNNLLYLAKGLGYLFGAIVKIGTLPFRIGNSIYTFLKNLYDYISTYFNDYQKILSNAKSAIGNFFKSIYETIKGWMTPDWLPEWAGGKKDNTSTSATTQNVNSTRPVTSPVANTPISNPVTPIVPKTSLPSPQSVSVAGNTTHTIKVKGQEQPIQVNVVLDGETVGVAMAQTDAINDQIMTRVSPYLTGAY